jgi:hypothetical protein
MAASRKLYIAVAETVGRELFFADDIKTQRAVWTLAEKIADDFKQDNAAFDRAKFLSHANNFCDKLCNQSNARVVKVQPINQ